MKQGFTLVEVLIVLVIIGGLIAILLPVFQNSREKGRQSACLSNIRQVALSVQAYANDNDGQYPPLATWTVWMKTHPGLPTCPSAVLVQDQQDFVQGYALNGRLGAAGVEESSPFHSAGDTAVPYPATTVLLCEEASGEFFAEAANTCLDWAGCGGMTKEKAWERHSGGANYTFVDGHAKWYLPTQVASDRVPNDGSRPGFALH